MLFHKLLLTRFIGMYLVLLLGACTVGNFGPDATGASPNPPTSIWQNNATQTAMVRSGTAQPGTPGATQANSTPGAPFGTAAATFAAGGTPQAPAGTGLSSTPAPGTPAGATGGQPLVVGEAREWLSQQLDEPLETIIVQNFERVDWPDTCLGLGQAGMGCAQVVTPGYRIVVYVNGSTYEVRTDETGRVFRVIEGGKG